MKSVIPPIQSMNNICQDYFKQLHKTLTSIDEGPEISVEQTIIDKMTNYSRNQSGLNYVTMSSHHQNYKNELMQNGSSTSFKNPNKTFIEDNENIQEDSSSKTNNYNNSILNQNIFGIEDVKDNKDTFLCRSKEINPTIKSPMLNNDFNNKEAKIIHVSLLSKLSKSFSNKEDSIKETLLKKSKGLFNKWKKLDCILKEKIFKAYKGNKLLSFVLNFKMFECFFYVNQKENIFVFKIPKFKDKEITFKCPNKKSFEVWTKAIQEIANDKAYSGFFYKVSDWFLKNEKIWKVK